MLSLITTEQSDPALINSTDVTIRNPSHKKNTVTCENTTVFIKATHTHTHIAGINCRWPGQRSSREESCCNDRKRVYCHCSQDRNYAHCRALNIIISLHQDVNNFGSELGACKKWRAAKHVLLEMRKCGL